VFSINMQYANPTHLAVNDLLGQVKLLHHAQGDGATAGLQAATAAGNTQTSSRRQYDRKRVSKTCGSCRGIELLSSSKDLIDLAKRRCKETSRLDAAAAPWAALPAQGRTAKQMSQQDTCCSCAAQIMHCYRPIATC
jgi:hypothetical protein